MGEIISSLIGAGLTAVGAATSIPFLIGAAVVGYIAATLSSVLLSLGGLLTGVAFNLQEMIISPNNNIVDVGWVIVRDVANLGFVLVIILIALATMFRIETYGVKKLLPRLIGAAILVNFSLAIAGIFIDFAQALAGFFLDRISLDPITIGTNLLGAFGPQRFWSGVDFNNIAGALTSLTSGAIMFVIGPYFITIFNLIMFLVVITLGFMLVVRFIYLSFLLIVAPLTWLFWLIPRLSGLFTQWWSKFFEWVFFAPAVSFFLYLAFFSAEALKGFTRGGEHALTGIDGIIGNIFLSGVEVILLGGFMIGGLIVAKNMGITGAKGAMGIFETAGKAAQGWAGKQAARAATRPLRGSAGRKLTSGLQTLGANRGWFLRNLSAPARTIGTALAEQRLSFEKKEADAAKLPKDLKEQALQYGSLSTSNAARVKIMENLVKERKGRLKKAEAEQKKVDEKDNLIRDLESQREEARKGGNIETINKLTVEIEKEEKARNELQKSDSYQSAQKNLEEINNVIASLPAKARDALDKTQYKVGETKLGALYGRKGAVMPGESGWDKVKEAVKAEEEGGGAEKKAEKKEEGSEKKA